MKLMLVALACASTLAYGKIRETNSIKEIFYATGYGDLIVFDLVNTILETTQTLGSNQWVDYMIKKGGDLTTVLAEWVKIQHITEVQTVEPQTMMIVNALQVQGHRVIALTSRPLEVADATVRQLLSLGIQFN